MALRSAAPTPLQFLTTTGERHDALFDARTSEVASTGEDALDPVWYESAFRELEAQPHWREVDQVAAAVRLMPGAASRSLGCSATMAPMSIAVRRRVLRARADDRFGAVTASASFDGAGMRVFARPLTPAAS